MVGSFERNWHEIESVFEAVEGVSKRGKLFMEIFLIPTSPGPQPGVPRAPGQEF